MTGRTGAPNAPAIPDPDPRIPFPRTEQPTACRANPGWFSHERTTGAQRERDIARAKKACRACPVAEGCLKWALANPDLTRVGVWAATTPRDRTALRQRLKERLGQDWVGAVAAQDAARAQHRQQARLNPPTVREQVLARLELELIPTRPTPYRPGQQPITPEQAAANRARLLAALREPRGAAA